MKKHNICICKWCEWITAVDIRSTRTLAPAGDRQISAMGSIPNDDLAFLCPHYVRCLRLHVSVFVDSCGVDLSTKPATMQDDYGRCQIHEKAPAYRNKT